MSMSKSPTANADATDPAQQLLKQYVKLRQDGIVEIKEPLPDDCDTATNDDADDGDDSEYQREVEQKQQQNNQVNKPARSAKDPKRIVERLLQSEKHNKKSAIINKLDGSKQSAATKTKSDGGVMGMNESWWGELEKDESKFLTDYRHKVDNIAMMRQYEYQKDPSPLNTDNSDSRLQKQWEDHLWQENQRKQEEFLLQKDAKKADQAKARVKKPKLEKPQKKSKTQSQQQYGNLVGFFNQKKSSSNGSKTSAAKKTAEKKASNPYLDTSLIENCSQFSPAKNQRFEQKFDHAQTQKTSAHASTPNANEFESMIITSHEFAGATPVISQLVTNGKPAKDQEPQPTQNKQEQQPAFTGRVFERKAPDFIMSSTAKPRSQTAVSAETDVNNEASPKQQSLFRKRMQPSADLSTSESSFMPSEAPTQTTTPTTTLSTITEHKDQTQKIAIAKKAKKEDIALIFLDVDGVLNCTFSPMLSRAHILRLKHILTQTENCKICISSTWRTSLRNKQQLMQGLRQLGDIDVDALVIGETPILPQNPLMCRPEEIYRYLKHDRGLLDNYNVLRWCAIDDVPLDIVNNEYSPFMRAHFVKTNPAQGMTDADAQKVIGILNASNLSKLELARGWTWRDVKLLFLNVDGVLNHKGMQRDELLSTQHLQRLKTILEATQCRIVWTSLWRRIPSAKQMLRTEIEKHTRLDIGTYIIGETPVLGSPLKKPMEICEYLSDVKGQYNVVSFVVVDDMPLDRMGTKETQSVLHKRVVKTNVETGLTDNDVSKILAVLNNTD